MELGLTLVATINAYRVHSKRKFRKHVISEVDCARLSMRLVNFKNPQMSCIIDCGELKTFNPLSFLIDEKQELRVDLHMMTRDLFFVAFKLSQLKSQKR